MDNYDNLIIGNLISESWLNNNAIISEAIGKAYDLKYRSDLTTESPNVRNIGELDTSNVYEVVKPYNQTTSETLTDGTQSTKLVDELGVPVEVDDITHSLQTIDYAHHEIHSGSHFFYTDYDTDVDTGSPKYYRITTPNTTKWTHIIFTLYSEGVGTWQIFENPTVNAAGTTATTFNNNRNSATTATIVVATDPTSTTDGTLLKTFRTGTGTNAPTRVGNEISRESEIILKQNEDYFVKFTPDSDNAKVKLELEWYEHTNK